MLSSSNNNSNNNFKSVIVASFFGVVSFLGAALGYRILYNPSESSSKSGPNGSSQDQAHNLRPVFLSLMTDADFRPITLVKKSMISPDTCILRFALEHPNQALGLPVGQHIMLRASISQQPQLEEQQQPSSATTSTSEQPVVVSRSYTPISCEVRDVGFVELVVKIYRANIHPKFPNGGKMSQHLDSLRIGDTVDVKTAPTGRFEYKNKGTFVIKSHSSSSTTEKKVHAIGLIAGGSGITPMYQIIRHVLLNDPEDTRTQLHLLFANHTEADILMRDELDELARRFPQRFKVWYTVTRPHDEKAGTESSDLSSSSSSSWKYSTGHFTLDMMKTHLPAASPASAIFMCGPFAMISSCCKPNLELLGYTPDQMFVF